jgi:ABC-type sugar transport system ATPase subunit
MNEAIEKGLAYLTESRKVDGLALALSVAENSLASVISRFSKGPFYSGKQHKAKVQELIDKLQIYTAGMDVPVQNLSGGNQQKVLLGKWLAVEPKIMILDEPTRGVDIGAKEIIHKAISELAAKGNAVILLTSDLPEMVGLSNRAVILRQGRIIGEIAGNNMSEQALLLAANGEGDFVK